MPRPSDQVAAALADGIARYHATLARPPGAEALAATIRTNTELVPHRVAPIRATLAARGIGDLHGVRVLDAGAGFGGIAASLAADGAQVTALDPNAAVLEVLRGAAHDAGLEVTTAVGTMEAPPRGPFDVVLVHNSLCYVVEDARRRSSLRALHEVTRPGGVLVVRDLNLLHPLDHFTRLPGVHLLGPARASRLADRLGRPRPVVRPTSASGLRRLAAETGWHDVRPCPSDGRGPALLRRAVACSARA